VTLSGFRTPATLAGLAVGLTGLVIDYWQIVPAMSAEGGAIGAFITFWSYFTHLTNLMIVLIYLANLTGARWLGWAGHPRTEALMAGYIALVMAFYHFLLAPYFTFEGWLLVATILLHYVAPTLYLVWWLLFARHGGLRFADIPLMLAPGLIYVGVILARGALTGIYPYDILDAAKNGYGGVAIGVAIIAAAVALFSVVVVLADRWMAARQR
jgi:hypothetical protein